MSEVITPTRPKKMHSTCRGFYRRNKNKVCNLPSAGIRPHAFLCKKHYIAKALRRKNPYILCSICGINILVTQNIKSPTCSEKCWKQNRINSGNKRSVALNNSSTITKSIANAVAKRDNYTCAHCGLKIDMKANKQKDHLSFHVDHLIPVLHIDSDHSSDLNHIDNLVASHRICNISKGNRDAPTDKTLKKVKLLVEQRFAYKDENTTVKQTKAHNPKRNNNKVRKGDMSFIAKIECPQTPQERKEIIQYLYNNGGFTKNNLAKIGVEWPPKKGWKSEAIAKGWQL